MAYLALVSVSEERNLVVADKQWKGSAAYHSLTPPSSSSTPSKSIENRIWSYPHPNTAFAPLKDYLSFYASTGQKKERAGGEWKCYVDDEEVGVQEG